MGKERRPSRGAAAGLQRGGRRLWYILPLALMVFQVYIVYYFLYSGGGKSPTAQHSEHMAYYKESNPNDAKPSRLNPSGTLRPDQDDPVDELVYDYELKFTNKPRIPLDENGDYIHHELRKLMKIKRNKASDKIVRRRKLQSLEPDRVGIQSAQTGPFRTKRRINQYQNYFRQQKIKKILLWTTFWGRRDFFFGLGRKPFIDHGCVQDACELTTDKSQLLSADAVLVHINEIHSPAELPRERTPQQFWVFHNMEPPQETRRSLKPYDGLFNLTATYRWDSDVPAPYGFSVPVSRVLPKPPQDTFKSFSEKTKSIVCFASNCWTLSKREQYVAELRRELRVDVYGKCGPLQCKRWSEACDLLVEDYKFYLALENAICKYYVTEKVFRALVHGTIPVVLGGADYKLQLPPESYIDVADYSSPRELARHLRRVGADPALYARYQAWRRTHRLAYPYGNMFCSLCSHLQLHSHVTRVVHHLHDWYNSSEVCRPPSKYYKGVADTLV